MTCVERNIRSALCTPQDAMLAGFMSKNRVDAALKPQANEALF